MRLFRDLRESLVVEATSGRYKGSKWRLSKAGSFYSLYVDDEKIDVFKSEAEGERAAKEFIDLSR